MKKILLFEEYIQNVFAKDINEASSKDLGFAAILGSTDVQNLGDAASNIGVDKNTTYTIKINSIKDLVSLGTKKSFGGFPGLSKGSSVPDKSDYIQVASKGQTKEIPQKVGSAGNIILDFDNSGIQVTTSNNGLLAFMRACTAAAQVFGKDGVDPQRVNGKFLISMGNPISGDSSRNAAFLAVSNQITGDNPLRISSGSYIDFWEPKIQSQPDKFLKYIKESEKSIEMNEQESMNDGSSLIRLVGDSLADSIRAASYQWDQPRSFYVNDSNCYKAFKNLYFDIKDQVKESGADSKDKNKDISALVLAMMMQKTIARLNDGYPMKKGDVDMVPVAKEILSQVGGSKSTSLSTAQIEDLLAKFAPDAYPKIPQFNPVLGDFWKSITSAVALRAASTFSNNMNDPGENVTEGPKGKVSGEEKSASKSNVSGGV